MKKRLYRRCWRVAALCYSNEQYGEEATLEMKIKLKSRRNVYWHAMVKAGGGALLENILALSAW